MSNLFKARDGYKTFSAHENEDGTVRIIVHRPPQAWLEFSLSTDAVRQLAEWLEGCKAHDRT